MLRPDPKAMAGNGLNIVAFSGGPDSLCLLHLMVAAELGDRLRAVHIDHGMDAGSAERAAAASALARQLGVACRVEQVDVDLATASGGPESAARHARYARLQAGLGPNDHLLTAHHADDQIETLMLRLLRGAGPAGLSGMPVLRRLGRGWLGRPLLDWHRSDIEAYLRRHGLEAVRDPGNEDCTPDRNYLRQRILPDLEARWPGTRTALLRVRGWQLAAAAALDAEAAMTWRGAARRLRSGEVVVDAERWLAATPHRALAAVRHWCALAGLRPPSSDPVIEFRQQCLDARFDRQPAMDWGDGTLHRFRGFLWLDRKPAAPAPWSIEWTPGSRTVGVPAGGYLAWTGPVPPEMASAAWRIGTPPAGARLRIARDRPRRQVRDLLRESGIPPWRRNAVPALFIDGELVAVGPDWTELGTAMRMSASDARLEWHERPATLLPSS